MQHCRFIIQNLLPAATIETTMEVVVDELWTRTVAKMPIIRPATGLLRISFEAKASPAAFPPNKRKALLRKSNEQMNKYRRPRSRTILVNAKATRRNFPVPSSSVGQQTERFDHTIISPTADPKIILETASPSRDSIWMSRNWAALKYFPFPNIDTTTEITMMMLNLNFLSFDHWARKMMRPPFWPMDDSIKVIALNLWYHVLVSAFPFSMKSRYYCGV